MFATELIGKLAVRSKPAKLGDGIFDYSYSADPIHILNATDCHIVVKNDDTWVRITGRKERLLDSRWCDNNWVDYEFLLVPASERFAGIDIGEDGEEASQTECEISCGGSGNEQEYRN